MSHASRASERPITGSMPTRTFANFGKRMTSPLEGESENCRVYIGDERLAT